MNHGQYQYLPRKSKILALLAQNPGQVGDAAVPGHLGQQRLDTRQVVAQILELRGAQIEKRVALEEVAAARHVDALEPVGLLFETSSAARLIASL